MDLSHILTEARNPNSANLDEMSALDIVALINAEDARVPLAVRERLPNIAALVDAIVAAFQAGGRLVYVGAGTSGRLGVLDASECPPTYRTDPALVVGLIAGGDRALRQSIEGAEDFPQLGADDLKAIRLTPADVVVGIAASGRTPYTIGAMTYARELGATVGCIVNTTGSEMERLAHHPIVLLTGPEVVTGSTRMKSGTSQKLVLNMLTTAAMIRLGKVYGNLMVDVQPTNSKLIQRARNIVVEATGASPDEAQRAIDAYGGAKAAIFALLSGVEGDDVARILAENDGHLKRALAAAKRSTA